MRFLIDSNRFVPLSIIEGGQACLTVSFLKKQAGFTISIDILKLFKGFSLECQEKELSLATSFI